MNRVIAWFSCGAASATAAKLAIEKYGYRCLVVCCDTRANEHPDNYRFSRDCEDWFGQPILFLKSPFYETIDDVFEKTRYMAGVDGARCTAELKKKVRQTFEKPDDIHIFGYTADKREHKRMANFRGNHPELITEWILGEAGKKKTDCYKFIKDAGIELPEMYKLGFPNNNCIGCVKSQSKAYWALTRKHFPDVFQRRAEQSRALGVRLVILKEIKTKDGKRKNIRCFLDELPEGDFGGLKVDENVSCGPDCTTSVA